MFVPSVASSSAQAARKLGISNIPNKIVAIINVSLLKFSIVVEGRPKVAHNGKGFVLVAAIELQMST